MIREKTALRITAKLCQETRGTAVDLCQFPEVKVPGPKWRKELNAIRMAYMVKGWRIPMVDNQGNRIVIHIEGRNRAPTLKEVDELDSLFAYLEETFHEEEMVP